MPGRREARTSFPDIVPLAGVCLVIVLIMMVTATQLLVHERTPVNVPYANTMERKTEENYSITLMLDEEGNKDLYLNDSLLPQPTLERMVTNKMSADPYYLIVIRADRSTPSQYVMDLLAMVRDAGAQRVALSTKASKKSPT